MKEYSAVTSFLDGQFFPSVAIAEENIVAVSSTFSFPFNLYIFIWSTVLHAAANILDFFFSFFFFKCYI